MPPAHVIKTWRDLGVSDDVLARALGVDLRTLERWYAGRSLPQHGARGRLAALLNVHEHLLDTFDSPKSAAAWLESNSRFLGGLKPIEALIAGRTDRIEAALEALDSGIFV